MTMSVCGQRAFLVVTKSIEGTTTNVARRKVELRCDLEAPHDGPHEDRQHGERWSGKAGQTTTTILRHEDEEP